MAPIYKICIHEDFSDSIGNMFYDKHEYWNDNFNFIHYDLWIWNMCLHVKKANFGHYIIPSELGTWNIALLYW